MHTPTTYKPMITLTEILKTHGYAQTESEANSLADTLVKHHLRISSTNNKEDTLEAEYEKKLIKLTENHKTLASIVCGFIAKDQHPIYSLRINGHGQDLAKTDQLLSSIGIKLKHS